jgi:HK97 family phage major capsid protein
MNKKMRELQTEMVKLNKEAEGYMVEGEGRDLDKAAACYDKIDALQKEFDLEQRREKAAKAGIPTDGDAGVVVGGEPKVDSTKAFADAARRGFKSMNESTLADGGYTVPEDIVTQIQHYRQSKASLLDLVTVVPVKTNKGARTFKTRQQQTGFVKVGEGGKIPGKDTPKYTRVEYEIEKYAGYFPVTSELLEDTDANIANELVAWIGDESRATANRLILEQINTKEVTPMAGLSDLQKALIVTLGAAFRSTSKVVTNDDGLLWLCTLEDKNGRPMLQPNPTEPTKLQLSAGPVTVPVEVYPNDDLPTDENGIPMIAGDLKEGIVYWDRKRMNIKTSDVAVVGELNAFEEDLHLFRAIEREDVTTRDDGAFVNGRIPVPAG